MNRLLIGWGVDAKFADRFDETLIALLMVGIGVGMDYICQAIFVGGMKHYTRRKPHLWNTLLVKRRVVHHAIHLLPALLIYYLLPLAFVHGKTLLAISQRISVVYIATEVILALNALLLMMLDLHTAHDKEKNRPLKSFVQVLQVVLFFVGGIVLLAILLHKSPMSLFAGLGASAAVLMLIFRDSILGFVAGVQLSANDMLRIGDWVQLPNGAANGTVEEITLNTVKIRNFDRTISTVPPYTLVNSAFINWRGMRESEGRRVSREIFLDMNTLHFCTTEETEHLCDTLPLLHDYRPQEGEMPTNAQLYRIYAERYLRAHPAVNPDMGLIVSIRNPSAYGLPLLVYFFLHNKVWVEYERHQSDIFDHLLVMVSVFGLKLYQLTYNPSSSETESSVTGHTR